MKREEKGITIIELAVVMSIVAIMTVFVAPTIGEWVENFRVRQTARDIASTLQLAKIKSVSSRLEFNVVFNIENNTYQLMRKDPNLGWTPEEDENKAPRGVDIDTNLTNETAQFNPNGTASIGTITITNESSKTYKVVVYRTGRIKIY